MTIYNYPCSVCQTKFDWAVPEPRLGNTCPSCNEMLMDQFVAWGETQEHEEQQLHERMDAWWDSLSQDAKDRAFFSVVKRLVQYECVEDLSYRQTLDRFGFDGSGSGYYLGILCGFMQLHNCIAPHEEMQRMRAALRTHYSDKERLELCKRVIDAYSENEGYWPRQVEDVDYDTLFKL